MVDKVSKKTRSYIMSRVRAKNTKPELTFKDAIKGLHIRYQPKIYGRPDFGSKKGRTAIFIDGCFWHKCPICYTQPKTNRRFWNEKVKHNRARDRKVSNLLRKEGYAVIRFWEHEIRDSLDICVKKIAKNHQKILNNVI